MRRTHPTRAMLEALVPRPAPIVCACGNEIRYYAHKDTNTWGWRRDSQCCRCSNLRCHHSMTLTEFEDFMSKGCAVPGCEHRPTDIDHDHAVCTKASHSCNRCRRGPLCRWHNSRRIAIIDMLRTGELQPELAYLGLTVKFSVIGETDE
jgi:hypothetical protein